MSQPRPLFLGLMAMHHIYCPEKRACIIERASHHGLQGVYLFGKPGRVVVEGSEELVKRYIKDVSRCGRWQICKDMGSMHSHEALGIPLRDAHKARVFPSGFGFQLVENDLALRKVLAIGLKAVHAHETICRPFNAPRLVR